MNISVFDLGHVGLVTAVCLAEQGHRVIGVETIEEKVEKINNGVLPIHEPGIDTRLERVIENGQFHATVDPEEAIQNSNVCIVCVGTPSAPGGEPELRSLETVISQIGQLLRSRETPYTVISRSTVLPGTGESIQNWLQAASGRDVPGEIDFLFVPEFMREGVAYEDFFDPPLFIFGGTKENGVHFINRLFPEVHSEPVEVDVREAELIKYTCNAFLAVKVGFANEVGRLSASQDLDGRDIMEVVRRDTKLNISKRYLKPGFALGGSSIPKNLRAMMAMIEDEDVDLPILESVPSSNQTHLKEACEMILEEEPDRVGVLGGRFKAGPEDFRASPTIELCGMLIEKGVEVRMYDPDVHPDEIYESNLEFVTKKVGDLEQFLVDSFDGLIRDTDCVMMGTHAKKYKNMLLETDRPLTVFDFHGLFQAGEAPDEWSYKSLCW